MKDDAVSSISMNSECKSEFRGIKIGDEYEKIETAFGDTYPLIGADEEEIFMEILKQEHKFI